MNLLRKIFDKVEPVFEKGGKLHVLYPLYEVIDSFFFTPQKNAGGTCHVRDSLDFKRMMMIVVYALIPCTIMGMYNVGYQANKIFVEQVNAEKMLPRGYVSPKSDTAKNVVSQADAASQKKTAEAIYWRAVCFRGIDNAVESAFGIKDFCYNPNNFIGCFVHGAFYFLPIYIVTLIVGGLWEVLFAIVRKHDVNEGFLVTGLLFPLTLPPTIPLWQVALGISFGVVIGKEVFGGTGRNFLNPALAGRAFLFFAYAGQISGENVWIAVDGFSGATPLTHAMYGGVQELAASDTSSWLANFIGRVPGSIGETSTIACLIGAAILLITRVASWRIMLSMTVGACGFAALLNSFGTEAHIACNVPAYWHFVLGGFAFGMVFMATDPVSASMTHVGQYIYGVIIGVTVIIVRVFNPGYPEGTMLAILFGNMTAPLIDYYVVKCHIAKRTARLAKN
ncbi:MAG: NADH:ubiquinone reductase (Na(+)-transporting) subunit B [Planctomycetaceae bacterium]|nr:NADH:ubiquinone reductase (Na(+)-transporting) subunit B [Planctomycetaceae bacterium]